ncbi:MAG: hypothetical protein CVU97_00410 [Firmicutes bacterium HGW-Firmicutes-21]|nr:MAG: hypothetical protein CVU97_00410 [Firmicutes bacterium HGW-Firmicutes-21]
MYFLFTTVLTASFLVCAEFTAVTFAPAVVLTALYLYLFSVYFKRFRRTAIFIPLVLLSVSIHISFFLIELQKDYIKDVSIWILASLVITVSGIMAYGTKSISGITAITNMAVPIFITLLILAVINILSGEITNNAVIGNNIYQYFITVISPPSTALALLYMHKCSFKKMFPAFVSSIVFAVCFFLFDSPFFRAIALNFIAPLIIAVELLVIKETVLPSQESINKNQAVNMQ